MIFQHRLKLSNIPTSETLKNIYYHGRVNECQRKKRHDFTLLFSYSLVFVIHISSSPM